MKPIRDRIFIYYMSYFLKTLKVITNIDKTCPFLLCEHL